MYMWQNQPQTYFSVFPLFFYQTKLQIHVPMLTMCLPIFANTVKSVLSGHSQIDKTKTLMTNGSLIKVESIAECSPWSILQYFWPALSDNRSWKPILVFYLSGRLRQVLLYLYALFRQPVVFCGFFSRPNHRYQWSVSSYFCTYLSRFPTMWHHF